MNRQVRQVSFSNIPKLDPTKDVFPEMDTKAGWAFPESDELKSELDFPDHIDPQKLAPEEGSLQGYEEGRRPNTPGEFFEHVFDLEYLEEMAIATNTNAEAKIEAGLKPEARLQNWKPCTGTDLKTMFALLATTGQVKKPSLESYWNTTDEMSITPFFNKIMARNRFQALYWNMKHPTEGADPKDPLHKVRPMLKMLNHRFVKAYRPGRRLSYDEASCAFRGKVAFLHYNPMKPDKYHIMSYVIAENTGYTLGVNPYHGEGTKESYKNVRLWRRRKSQKPKKARPTFSQGANSQGKRSRIQALAKKVLSKALKRSRRNKKKRNITTMKGKNHNPAKRPIRKKAQPTFSQGANSQKKRSRIQDLGDDATMESLGVLSRQVLGHMDACGLLDKGYFVCMDNMYTSPELFEALAARETFACGTIKPSRDGWPIALGKKPPRLEGQRGKVPDPLKDLTKLQRGDIKVRRNGPMLALQWQDKKHVNMLSTIHLAKTVKLDMPDNRKSFNETQRRMWNEFNEKRKRKKLLREKKKKTTWEKEELKALMVETKKEPRFPVCDTKPMAVFDYNFDMGGPDHLGQLIDNYDFLRATVRWTTKFTVWLFSVAVVNAFVLHQKFGSERDMSHYEFRRQLIDHLLKDITQQPPPIQKPIALDRLRAGQAGRHFPEYLPSTNIRDVAQRDCVVCTPDKERKHLFQNRKGQLRKRTSYKCIECDVNLCPSRCFELYHTVVNYNEIGVDLRLQRPVRQVKPKTKKSKSKCTTQS